MSTVAVLNRAQIEAFEEQGYVIVRQVFPRSTAEELLKLVWDRVEEDPDNPRSWKRAWTQIEEVIEAGPIDEIFTERFRASVDELVGAGRWTTRRGFGWVILRFPGFHKGQWEPPPSGWHVDGIDFQHHLNSPEQGLAGIEMLTDVKSGGGGTAVRVGSHRTIARLLRDSEPKGLSYPDLRKISEELAGLPVVEATGKAGDVLWMHPFTIHARSPNARQTVRVGSNRCIRLLEPMDFCRPAPSDYSPVERAILKALAPDQSPMGQIPGLLQDRTAERR
jgi:ectoine hydroxylase-related dioxygenase (phytanoyl-CoA dioxygenase family)